MCAKLAKGDVGLRHWLAWAGLALIDPLQTKVRDGAGREHVTAFGIVSSVANLLIM